jgi:hypothetical protein
MNERLIDHFLTQQGYTPEEIEDIKMNAQDYIYTPTKETKEETK